MSDLDTRIREAQEAAAELARLEQLRAELPALQVERENRQREQHARAALDAATETALLALSEYRSGVGVFQAQFDAWIASGRELAERLHALEAGIPQTAAVLAGAVAAAQRNGVQTMPAAALWQQLGWCDVAAALPNRNDGRVFRALPFDERAGALLAELAGVTPYEPSGGIRAAGVRV